MEKKQYPNNTRAGAIAVVSCIVLLLIVRYALSQWSPFGSNGGSFSFYRGPVLPMTSLSGGEGLTVQRHVDFDFSPYETTDPAHEVILTDSYRLTNPTDEPVTVQLAYPFEGQLIGEEKYFPAITVKGSPVDAALFPSVDAKGAVDTAKDWEDYTAALIENDFLAEAMAEAPSWEEPVIVYRISDIQYDGTDEAANKYLNISYTADSEKTTLWTYGLGAGEDYVTLNFPEPESPWDTGVGYILVLGQDISLTGQQGHHTYSPGDDANKLEGMTANIVRFESTFGEMVWALAQEYPQWPQYDERFSNSPYNTPEILYSGAMKRILDEDYHNAYRSIDEVFYAVLSERVMMYYVFPVEIAPGETVTVDAVYHQQASEDNSGSQKATDGYDMATGLGSDLNFSGLSASVSNTAFIKIVEQNFGFLPESNITNVILDPEIERYYMEIQTKE